MAARRHRDRVEAPEWLTLTDLGRIYGISAVHCGRLLSEAGLRDGDGHPTDRALQSGCASPQQHRHGGQPCWHRQHCGGAFEAAGLKTVRGLTLVQQWADLLSAMAVGSPAISTSAAQMAEEMPAELLEPVNRQLRRLGSSFQVQRSGAGLTRTAAATSGARREPQPVGAAGTEAPVARVVRRPRAHGASG
jgi:hypothetical protein